MTLKMVRQKKIEANLIRLGEIKKRLNGTRSAKLDYRVRSSRSVSDCSDFSESDDASRSITARRMFGFELQSIRFTKTTQSGCITLGTRE